MASGLQRLIDQELVEQHLKKGSDHSDSITLMQQTLFELGYGEPLKWKQFGADGDFGDATLSALKVFAENNELPFSGDSVTVAMVHKMLEHNNNLKELRNLKRVIDMGDPSITFTRGSQKNQEISALQRILHGLGLGEELRWEEFGADGIYGDATANAVKTYAQRLGWNMDGESVSKQLLNAILQEYIPKLGKDWFSAMRPSRLTNSQFNKTYPAIGAVHKFTERFFRTEHLETYINRKKRDENGRFVRENRTYSYAFDAMSHFNPQDGAEIPIFEVKKYNEEGNRIASFFYPLDHAQNKPKDKIVLHFTAGRLSGDLQTLTQEDYHVSTAFLLGRDGTIYQLFSAKQWSHHIGGSESNPADRAMGGNKVNESNSVGIEISNWGPLDYDEEKNILTTYTGNNFCELDETDAYIQVPQRYRLRNYFARPTEEQYESLILLLRYLTNELGIAKTFLPKGKRQELFASDEEANSFKGICCHTNFRPGKWDWFEEGFDWERIIQGVEDENRSIDKRVSQTRSMIPSASTRTEDQILEEMKGLDNGDPDTSKYGTPGWEVEI